MRKREQKRGVDERRRNGEGGWRIDNDDDDDDDDDGAITTITITMSVVRECDILTLINYFAQSVRFEDGNAEASVSDLYTRGQQMLGRYRWRDVLAN